MVELRWFPQKEIRWTKLQLAQVMQNG